MASKALLARSGCLRTNSKAISRVFQSPAVSVTANATWLPCSSHDGRTTTRVPFSTDTTASFPTAGQTLAQLASASPHVEVIRYEHKNVKWTLAHVEYFADALAVGMLETGLAPGDAVLSWLPLHFSEQHILQFACSKAGFVLYHLDPALAMTDPATAKKALDQALTLSEATVLVTQDVGDGVRYVDLVKQVIPETRIFAFQDGMPFITPRYPHLRFPMHVGFDAADDKYGFCLLRHFLIPRTGFLEDLLGGDDVLDGATTALLGEFVLDQAGVPTEVKPPLSNKEVLEKKMWPEMKKILNKEYSEVEGVGVIF